MRARILALLLLPDLAMALDLRGVELGDSCDRAEHVEARLGSTPKYDIASMRTGGILGFENQSSPAGTPIEILYNCSDQPGVVSHYSIAVTSPDETSARQALDRARADVVAKVGAPSSDSDLLPLPRKEQLAQQAWVVRALAWKNVPNQSITILLTHRRDVWRVSTLVQAKGAPSDEGKPEHAGISIDVASDGSCDAAGLHVSCSDIGTKLREAGIPLDTWITFRGPATVSYDVMKPTIDSLARAGFKNMKIGFITEPAS